MSQPKITFLVDSPNWAYDYVARSIKKRLSGRYRIDIKYVCFDDNISKNDSDLLYVFFWGESIYKKYGYDNKNIIKEVASLRWKSEERYGKITPVEFAEKYLNDCAIVTTPAISIHNMLCNYHEDVYHAPNGVDVNFYRPGATKGSGREFTIGWVGNPDDACKGLNDILIPAASGFNFKYTDGRMTRCQLSKFYREIDVLAIASVSEGQPLPLLESLSSGCFPVATNVGIVPELIVTGVNGLIVERNVDAFRDAFEWCSRNLKIVRGCSELNRAVAVQRSWDICAERFDELFSYALAKSSGNFLEKPSQISYTKRVDSLAYANIHKDKSSMQLIFNDLEVNICDIFSRIYYGNRYRLGLYPKIIKKLNKRLYSSLFT